MADKITGFKELHDALGQFKKSTERGVLNRVAKKALQPMLETAKAMAPVDTGELRDSINLATGPLTRGAKREDRQMPKRGVRMYVGTADRNAVPQEYGTYKSAAQPFMRPAWEMTKDRMLEGIADDLWAEIKKTADRAAKRTAKR